MTVNKKNRSILFLTVLLFVFSLTSLAFGEKKNILRIHFQTITVKPSTTDIVLNVTYKIEAARSPVFFHGFECRYFYDQTKIRPTDKFFDGTASQNADFKGSGGDPTIGEYRIEVLSSSSLDTSNPILFQVRYSVKGFTDSAMISPSRFDALHDASLPTDSQIDTVIIDNAPGRDDVGWYPFAIVYMDTTKLPPPPKKKTITLSIDSTDIESDSVKVLSLNVSSLDSTNIKGAIFEFDIDTLAFDSVVVLRGALLANGSLAVSKDSTHIAANFSGFDTSKPGELLKIVLKGNKRTDTLCTGLLHAKLTFLNADNLVSSIAYKLEGLCILGRQKKDTVTTGVAETGGSTDLVISPNPANSIINFHLLSDKGVRKHLVVFDALGRKVLDQMFGVDFRWEVASMPVGFYTATVTDIYALHSDSIQAESKKILIIH